MWWCVPHEHDQWNSCLYCESVLRMPCCRNKPNVYKSQAENSSQWQHYLILLTQWLKTKLRAIVNHPRYSIMCCEHDCCFFLQNLKSLALLIQPLTVVMWGYCGFMLRRLWLCCFRKQSEFQPFYRHLIYNEAKFIVHSFQTLNLRLTWVGVYEENFFAIASHSHAELMRKLMRGEFISKFTGFLHRH